MALAVPQPRSSRGDPAAGPAKVTGGLPGLPGQGIDSSGGRFGACRSCVPSPRLEEHYRQSKGLPGPFPSFVGSQIDCPKEIYPSSCLSKHTPSVGVPAPCPLFDVSPVPHPTQEADDGEGGDTYVESVPEQRGSQGRTARAPWAKRHTLHRHRGTVAGWGIRACTTCGA